MKKSGGTGKKKQPDAIDEVEELLNLTQDQLLLKLTVNSHTKSTSKFDAIPESSDSNAIHPDLDRRFRALRSKPNLKKGIPADREDVDNLFARFAALKAPDSTNQDMKIVKDESGGIVDVEGEEEDEVQKIINWAIDAARLDPSPSSDFDDDEDRYSDSDSDEASPVVALKNKGSKK